jgi:hypothetical protein
MAEKGRQRREELEGKMPETENSGELIATPSQEAN